MENQILFEQVIQIDDHLSLLYSESSNESNLVFLENTIELITKPADELSFRGLFNMLAYFTQSEDIVFDYDGVILYSKQISLNDQFYLTLEETLEEEDEGYDEDVDGMTTYTVSLYYRRPNDVDLELNSFYLDEEVILLFDDIHDFHEQEHFLPTS
jgi:hypothetical protein